MSSFPSPSRLSSSASSCSSSIFSFILYSCSPLLFFRTSSQLSSSSFTHLFIYLSLVLCHLFTPRLSYSSSQHSLLLSPSSSPPIHLSYPSSVLLTSSSSSPSPYLFILISLIYFIRPSLISSSLLCFCILLSYTLYSRSCHPSSLILNFSCVSSLFVLHSASSLSSFFTPGSSLILFILLFSSTTSVRLCYSFRAPQPSCSPLPHAVIRVPLLLPSLKQEYYYCYHSHPYHRFRIPISPLLFTSMSITLSSLLSLPPNLHSQMRCQLTTVTSVCFPILHKDFKDGGSLGRI